MEKYAHFPESRLNVPMKSYIKFLSRNKLYTAIEAVGLAVSLAFVIIIGNYAYQQWQITRETEDYERIYTFGMPGSPGLTFAFTDIIKERVPEVESVARYSMQNYPVMVDGNSVSVNFIAVDQDFYEMFPQYGFVSGSADLLVGTNVFVSESFANANSVEVGESLKLGSHDLNVVGIVEDFDRTLFVHGDVIVDSKTFIIDIFGYNPYDQFGSVLTFAKVAPGTDRDELYKKVDGICKEIYGSYGSMFFEYMSMYRFDELYFGDFPAYFDQFNEGDLKSLKILLLVGLLLFISAVFNYVNLSVALTGRRAKEMATRRLLGASRMSVFVNYIVESVSFTAVCFGFALLLAVAVAPVVNTLLNDPDIPVSIVWSWSYMMVYLLVIVLVGTVVGLAPAVLASRFKPIEVIKGAFRAKSKMTFSKIFIVLQNAISVILLALALVMEAQYTKSLDRPMHSNTEDKYFLMAFGLDVNQEPLENALRELPCVKRLGFANAVPGYLPGGQFSLTRDGQDILYRHYRMDSVAFEMLEFEVLKDFGAPEINAVWFGEKAFAASGFDDEYHDITVLHNRAANCDHVAGVIADFPNNSSNIGAEDYIIISYCRRSDMRWGGWLMETVGDRKEAERQIKAAYEKVSKDMQLTLRSSSYIDDYMVEQMKPTLNNMRLIEIFMLLSIIISLLGLVAMSTYYASETSKDIAVRKVFGGTVESETMASVKRYMILVSISLCIGIPVAVWASGKYLEQFIWKLDSYWWTFVAAALLTLFFAFGSVIFQTIKAARTNPGAELKKE